MEKHCQGFNPDIREIYMNYDLFLIILRVTNKLLQVLLLETKTHQPETNHFYSNTKFIVWRESYKIIIGSITKRMEDCT